MNACLLKRMENTFVSCPDMLGIMAFVLTPPMESPVKTHLLSICCEPEHCGPEVSHGIALSEDMGMNHCKPGQ